MMSTLPGADGRVSAAYLLRLQSAAHDVYVALMDWFERQSRPPSAPQPKSAPSIICGRSTAGSSETGSTIAKSTFYGADAAGEAGCLVKTLVKPLVKPLVKLIV
jgi:hypothetical protein